MSTDQVQGGAMDSCDAVGQVGVITGNGMNELPTEPRVIYRFSEMRSEVVETCEEK